MTQTEATQVLINAGFNEGEAAKIIHTAIRSGSALTVPRNCPSLFVDVYNGVWRIMENDSGIIYNLATVF